MSHYDLMGKKITLHGPEDFSAMHAAGKLAAETLDYITPYVVPGVSTEELNTLCHDFIIQHKAIPAPLNYRGFPKSICTSPNHVICHGIPGPKTLKFGDILNIDVTVILDGWHGDTSRMFYIGKPSIKAKNLVETTYECLMSAIDMIKPGMHLGDIGAKIQTIAEKKGYSVVREFCGHGLGQVFHAPPEVLHYGKPGEGVELVPGMFFTIEPMINIGKKEVRLLSDGWTAVTRDKSLSAQFEHSLGVTETGCEIFTLSPKGYTLPPYE
jgi:methionyl aminopeptidase